MVVVENAHSTIDACDGIDAHFIYARKVRQILSDMQGNGAKIGILTLKYVNIY